MIEHVYTIVCAKTAVDQETNQVTLIDVTEEITIHPSQMPPEEPENQTPFLSFGCAVVTYWMKTNEDGPNRGRSQLVLQHPSGKQFQDESAIYDIDLTQNTRVRVHGRMTAIPVGEWGLYWFLVLFQPEGESSWKEVGRYPLFVRKHTLTPS